ncbi:hypothetical protein [Chryseolinea lacunae]|uniref:TANFOR domain-containing protein n=1 Tax=Chryseolinea lacunae TaxID=2801331 RepID=A0ABS1KKC2_9BACT|nr:hypothetical protein [Chryseolinea lacunae]MBL0739905.1 hypothetical protein [Chryseolinea lacunae]
MKTKHNLAAVASHPIIALPILKLYMALAVFASLFVSFCAQAQNEVMVSVVVAPPYSTKVDYFQEHPQQVIITLISRSQLNHEVQLRGAIIGENGIEVRAGAQYRSPQPITLQAGETKVLNALAIRELFDIDKLQVRGASAADLRAGNGLPEGMYRICARAYDYNRPEIALSTDEPSGCSNMIRLTNLEPPMLIKPFFDEVIRVNGPQNVVFTWSFPAGAPPSTMFKLKIVDIFNRERNINDAMQSSTVPPFFEQDVTGNAFLFGPAQPTLVLGRKYAFMVTAYDPFGRTVFRNGGRSEVSTFTYGEAAAAGFPNMVFKVMNAAPPGAIVCGCLEGVPGGAVDNSKAIVGSKVKIGKFEMTVLESREDAGVLKGRGKINFPMINSKLIPLLVEFSDLQVNGSNQALAGTVKAKVKSDVNFIPAAPAPNIQSVPFTSSDAQKLDEYFKANVQQLVSNINTAIDNAGFEMPLGLDKNIGGIGTVIAITGATFTPQQATFEAATVVNIPDGATKIALGARGVCMDNAGLCGQGTLFLSADFNIAPLNMMLKGVTAMPVNPLDSGTYVVFDKDGFKKLRIQAEYAFPTSMLVKKVDKVSQVKATLTASAVSWSNWMAKVNIDPFYLSGNEDFGFSIVGSGTYDHSSTSNPVGMPVIAAKTNINTPDWNGFYLPTLSVELPAVIKKIGGGPPLTAAVKNLIIDNQGLSGSVNAVNVLAIGDGDLGGWYYSVDNIGVDFLNNSFVQGGMNGKVILPISGSSTTNPKSQLDYTSTLSKPAGSLEFQFVVKPKNDLDVPLWYSKFNLLNTSSILVTAGGGKDFFASATLNGSLDIIADLSPLSKINFRAIEFEKLKIQTVVPYVGVEKFVAGFASPDKSLAGFPIGLQDVHGVFAGTQAGIGFTMKVRLCDIASIPEADFAFDILGKVGVTAGRPDWKYEKVAFKAISLKGPIGPVSIDGDVNFFDKDPEFGNGVRGSLTATLLSGFSAKAQVLFGNTSFSYWYVDARLQLPPPGIALSPPIPLSIFGFGGGAYYHLAQKPLLNAKDLYSPTPPPLTNLYTPNANAAGFKATIIMGVSDGSSFQVSGTFEATINAKTMAPIMMKLQVDAAMLSPLMQTDKAFIKGTGIVSYDFANDIFDAAVGVNVNLISIINGHGFLHLNVNGSTKEFFFKVGEPSDRVTLSVLDFINVDGYFMMGNSGIPGIPPPPPQVLAQIKGYDGPRAAETQTGAGLAFGASMSYGPADLKFLIFYMKLGAGIGFDIALRQITSGCNGGNDLPGINGWYANGQMYMWAQFAFGLYVDTFFFTGRISVASLEAAALLRAGLPNPTWFDGWLHGQYDVLNGLISGNMNFHVQVGDKCVPQSDPFGGVPLISELSPGGTNVSIMADPQATFNYPISQEFNIPTLDDDGNEVERTYLIELLQFDVVDEKTGAVVWSKDNNREFRVTDQAKLATIYTAKAFDPQNPYKIRVKVQAFEIKGGTKIPCKYRGNNVEEYKELAFKTGECITDLKGAVMASYPIARQRYLLQKEAAFGYIEITKDVPCLMNMTNYTVVGIFKAYQSKGVTTTVEVPLTYNDAAAMFSFPMPALPNDQIVQMTIVMRAKVVINTSASTQMIGGVKASGTYTGIASASNFSYDTKNRYVGINNFVDVKSSAVSNIATSIKKTADREIFQYYFKTSKYNTLAEKFSRSETSATAQKAAWGILELYSADYGMTEGFDVFDIHGFAYGLDKKAVDRRVGPLVIVSEARPKNRWSESQAQVSFYRPWGQVFYAGFYDEMSPRYIRPFSTPLNEVIGFETATRPIDFLINTIDPPLSNVEIQSEVVNNYVQVMNATAVSSKDLTKIIYQK